MARTFTASTTYAENSSAPVTATPITLSAWVNPTAVAAIGSPTWIFRIGNHTSYDQGFALQQAEASGFFRYRIHAGASVAEPFQSGFTAGAWQHIAGVSTSATNHTCYRNGVAGSAVTTSVTPSGVNYTSVGRLDALGGVDYFNGAIGECAAWNVALTAGEIAALAKGARPSMIRPESLVFYDPIFGFDSPEPDLTSGHRNLTLGGSPAFAAGPPVQPYLYVPQEWTAMAAAGAPATLATRRALLGVGV